MNNQKVNNATLRFVQSFGILGGLTGIGHGVFEVLQGNKAPTDIATRIGAFTIIPNYLLTGVLTILTGMLIIYWLLFQIKNPRGVIWFFFFIVCLFLVGGGVAPILGLFIVSLVATQIRNDLKWWRRINSSKSLDILANSWKSLLFFGGAQLLAGIGIWLFLTPPGQVYEISLVQYICWTLLLLGTCFIVLSIFAGFAWDIKQES